MFKFIILKNFIQKIKNIKNQKNILNSLQAGDLVWAKMPLSKKELKLINETHQIRPYLVIHKDKFNIYAYQCSSKQSNYLNNCEEYFINKLRYKLNKNSYINLSKLYKIPLTKLKSKYITLNQLDLKNIQKRLQICSSIYSFLIDIYILEGDVIRVKNQLYYVYAADNIYLYCLTIFKKLPKNDIKYHKIIINNKTYYTTFKEKVSFERTTKMDIVNIAYKSEAEIIINQKRGIEYKQKSLSNFEKKMLEQNHEVTYENGTVFKIGKNKIVYLFKYKNIHYGVDLLMYKIKPRSFPINDIEKKQIFQILPLDEYINIVEFLSLNCVQPLNRINALYDELRELIYY